MREETDCSVVETALRECEEEIQLQRDVVKVTSVLPSLKLVLLLLLIFGIAVGLRWSKGGENVEIESGDLNFLWK